MGEGELNRSVEFLTLHNQHPSLTLTAEDHKTSKEVHFMHDIWQT